MWTLSGVASLSSDWFTLIGSCLWMRSAALRTGWPGAAVGRFWTGGAEGRVV